MKTKKEWSQGFSNFVAISAGLFIGFILAVNI